MIAREVAPSWRIKVILFTGHLEDEITSKAQWKGAFAVLPKPCGLSGYTEQ